MPEYLKEEREGRLPGSVEKAMVPVRRVLPDFLRRNHVFLPLRIWKLRGCQRKPFIFAQLSTA